MEQKRKTRTHRTGDFKPPEDLEDKVKVSVNKIIDRMPQEWEAVMQWLRSKAIAVPVNPNDEEVVKAEYHRKSQVVQIVNKLQGFELV